MEDNNTQTQSYHTIGNKMQSTNFLYWLQGCFEMGCLNTLSAKQIEVLKKHMEITEDDHKFLTFLRGFLIGKEKGLNKVNTKILKEELESCFKNITNEKKSGLTKLLEQFPKKEPTIFGPHPSPPYPWLERSWPFKPGDIIC